MEQQLILNTKIAGVKTVYNCPNCKSTLHHRVSRGWIAKNLLFWMPVKRYRCDKCFKLVYVRKH